MFVPCALNLNAANDSNAGDVMCIALVRNLLLYCWWNVSCWEIWEHGKKHSKSFQLYEQGQNDNKKRDCIYPGWPKTGVLVFSVEMDLLCRVQISWAWVKTWIGLRRFVIDIPVNKQQLYAWDSLHVQSDWKALCVHYILWWISSLLNLLNGLGSFTKPNVAVA